MLNAPTYESSRSAIGLAASFGWIETDLKSADVRRGQTSIDVQKGIISGQAAAVFGTVRARNGSDPLNEVALYAYHANAPWGVLADDAGLTVFNSQWLNEDEWFRLPRIRWQEMESRGDLLQALTPRGLLAQQPAKLATRIREPTAFLKPVDDALVERLDRWRDQALRYASHTERVDEQLQTFYAQLFVLRTVEDRALDRRVEPASRAVNGTDQFDRVKWEELLGQAKSCIGSDLFDRDVTTAIADHVLAGVVQELYRPYGIPGSNARYNFAWIDADVLGLAYEKYLASVLQPTSLPLQVDLFLPAERAIERRSVRKSAGAYYTPRYITNFVSSSAIDGYYRDSPCASPPFVIDFACGSGSFLVAAIDRLLAHLRKSDPTRPWARELIEGGHIAGIDVDPKAVTAARLHLWQRLIEEPDALPLPSLNDVVIAADGLDRTTWGKLNREYDIVLGNPPFLTTNQVIAREELETRFKTARGRYDISSLFIEQAVTISCSAGRIGLVVPNRLFRNKSGAPVRRLISEQVNLEIIVDFGTTKPFDADAYIGCILAQKRSEETLLQHKVQVIEVRSLEPDFLTALLLTAAAGEIPNSAALKMFFARHPRGDSPWLLLSEQEQMARIQVEEFSVRLDSIASIPQGIRTGGNDFFFVTLKSEDGESLSLVENGLGEEFIIESVLLRKSVYGSQVRRYERVDSNTRLIYPYMANVAVAEGELEQHYPHAYGYFLRNRDILSARSSLSRAGRRYYELVWPRDEAWLRRPKLLIRDLAPSTSFAADPAGEIFLVGGTAVVPEDPEMLMTLMSYLNSAVIDKLVKQTTTQFSGSFQKFEPQHIQGIPILDKVLEDSATSGALSELAIAIADLPETSVERVSLEARVNHIVSQAAFERGVEL